MELAKVAAGVAWVPAEARGLVVSGVERDSRRVEPGQLFVAGPGLRHDGAAYAAVAVERGARAVISERPLELPVPVLVVPSAARALGLCADNFHGQPSREVAVVGVTGTNGKTTTTFLTQALLEQTGRPAALLGTVCGRVAGEEWASSQTTPCALETHSALARARDAGERHLAMEVSSHALDQERVAGVRYRVAVLTNLSRDHLDYHGTMDAYGDAKARLFEDLAPEATAVLNLRDPFGRALARRTPAQVLTYGWREEGWPPADFGAWVLGRDASGTELALRYQSEEVRLRLGLLGAFNVENALAAGASGLALGLSLQEVAAGLAACPAVPGRLERIEGPPGSPTVLVDYAHTPDALERVLSGLAPLTPGELWTVFGCGGERDKGKRAPMGQAALRHAQRAILTSDNPRSEDPAAIAADVLAGCPAGALLVELDRAAAIDLAVRSAGPQDVVVIAGKGHETEQVIGSERLPFDDREVARQALAHRARLAA